MRLDDNHANLNSKLSKEGFCHRKVLRGQSEEPVRNPKFCNAVAEGASEAGLERHLPKERLCLPFNYDAVPVYPGYKLLQRFEREGAVPDELAWEVDAVPAIRDIDLDLGLCSHRMSTRMFVI